ncbi:MAG: SRPBCC family protein [Solirubrobacteraceae bacterium]
MVVRRSRTVAAPLDDVWQIVRDPYHLPRWWPRTQRVEGVSSGGWTSVLVTDKGRSVRADYRVELTKAGERRRWAQEVAGTPFEKLFREVVYEVALLRTDAGTGVAIEVHQRPVGWARFGGVMLRRAAKTQLDDALKGLAGLLEGGT